MKHWIAFKQWIAFILDAVTTMLAIVLYPQLALGDLLDDWSKRLKTP